jgi:hypothetical protein
MEGTGETDSPLEETGFEPSVPPSPPTGRFHQRIRGVGDEESPAFSRKRGEAADLLPGKVLETQTQARQFPYWLLQRLVHIPRLARRRHQSVAILGQQQSLGNEVIRGLS